MPGEVRWLLVSAIGITLITTAGLIRTLQLSDEHHRILRSSGWAMVVSAVLIVILGFSTLDTIPILLILSILMLAPVFFAFQLWLDLVTSKENKSTEAVSSQSE
jgi:hypothetical protein